MLQSSALSKFGLALCACLVGAPLHAQWLLGPIILVETDRFHNNKLDFDFIPYIAWESERWHIGIDEISVDISKRDDIRFELLAEPRYSLDSPAAQFESLERDFALEAGVSASVDFFPWAVTMTALSDVTGSHDGQSISFGIGQEFPLGPGYAEFELITEFKGAALAMHLYGIEVEESNVELQAYEPGIVLSAAVSATYFYQIGAKMGMQVELELNALPERLLDSPRLNERFQAEAYIAVIRQF